MVDYAVGNCAQSDKWESIPARCASAENRTNANGAAYRQGTGDVYICVRVQLVGDGTNMYAFTQRLVH